MRNRFDLQLKQLNDDIIEMGNMIERAIEMGVYALIGHDTDKAKQTIDYDMDIDHMERDIEALCMKLLLQQQPVARDLRQISSALKMITDMERIGDQASDIAELSLQLGDVSDIDEISLIQKMANETMMMVVRGTEAYVTKDLDVAHNVIDNDDVVDDLFDQIKMALVKRIQDNHVKSFEAADLLMVAKYFERIGDHAINILENAEKRSKLNEKFTGAGKEELTTMYKEVLELFDKSMEMFVTNKKDNIDQIIDMENDVDQMQIDYQNQQVKRLSKGICGVEIGLIFTDMVIGLERIADHSTNIAYSIFHENPEDAEEQQKAALE